MRVPPLVKRSLWVWEVPFLAVLAWLMFRWRMASYALNVSPEHAPGRVFYMGTDPYFHLRAVLVSLEHFPASLRWDPWTFFPRGTFTGQFGTLFDQALAAWILLVHGDAWRTDPLLVQSALAAYPAVLGALCVVPVYYVAKRMFGNPGAAWAAILVALLPGSLLARSVAGYADHHVAEVLMSTFAVLGVLVSVERERAREDVFRDWRAHPRRDHAKALLWALPGAVGLALYLWTWPPGVLFVAILTAALATLVGLDHARGRTSRGTAFAAAAAFLSAALLVLPLRDTNGFEVTFYTWTQPATLVLAAAFLVALAWGSERLAPRLKGYAFVGVVVAAGFLLLAVLWIATPSYFKVLSGGFQWVTGIGYGGGGRTIAEARASTSDDMFREYGALFYGAILGFVLLLVDVARRPAPSNVVLLVWSAFMAMAAFNQVRFHYYFAVDVALLNGFLLATAARLALWKEAWRNTLEPPAVPKGRKAVAVEKLGWKQPAALAAAVVFVLPGNVFVYDGALECRPAEYRPAWAVAKCFGPDREIQVWTDGLAWVRENTPDPGFRVTDLPDKATFAYPPSAYGVISWWDYGHYIEVLGERAPVANPFQQAAPFASKYFTARSEAEAEELLAEWSPDRPVRYVLIDDASASTKFYAITVWAGFPGYGETTADLELDDGGTVTVPTLGTAYRETMMNRLYHDDAEGLAHYRLVHEERAYTLTGNVLNVESQRLEGFNDMLRTGSSASFLADGVSLGLDQEEASCLDPRGGTCVRYAYEIEAESALKVFERVKGATVVGTGEPGETVTALLDLEAENTDRVIQLTLATVADATGAWSLVVPYPTTQFLSPEQGGTRADVVPKGEWLFALGDADSPRVVQAADVPERAVLDGLEVRAS